VPVTMVGTMFYVKLTEIDMENIDKQELVKNDFKTRKPA
jgi:hypothetical protein